MPNLINEPTPVYLCPKIGGDSGAEQQPGCAPGLVTLSVSGHSSVSNLKTAFAIRAGQNRQLRKVEQINVSAIGATRHAGMCIIRDLDQSFCG
jgi:hypothetical protein